MREKSGSQDPIWASYGGFNSINFKKNNFKINRLNLKKKNLDNISKNLFLIYTGINKFSHNIEKDKLSKIDKNIKYLDKIYLLAKEFEKKLIVSKNYDFIGSMLNDYWEIKKSLSKKVSNNKIDEIYDECLNSGALGGKIIGSGGGGFLLIHCKKRNLSKLKKRLNKLAIINFNFTQNGSEIIFKS